MAWQGFSSSPIRIWGLRPIKFEMVNFGVFLGVFPVLRSFSANPKILPLKSGFSKGFSNPSRACAHTRARRVSDPTPKISVLQRDPHLKMGWPCWFYRGSRCFSHPRCSIAPNSPFGTIKSLKITCMRAPPVLGTGQGGLLSPARFLGTRFCIPTLLQTPGPPCHSQSSRAQGFQPTLLNH